jgi:tetratricopeptide (TPR) repeat protein
VVPRDAWRDLRATVPPNVLDDVVRAVGTATEALEAGDDARAMELLAWAKSVAPRSATIREALGVAHYAAERFGEAHSELLAYRRLSGAQDQNHVLADCARAAGRRDKVREYVEEMIAARVGDDRIAEGLMVLAGDRADQGDLEGALETLERAGLDPDQVQPYHPRLWYLAGDLSERLGRPDAARDYFEAILAVDEEFGDVGQRLAALDG